jgi:uncharacterized membrane protein YqhA
MSLSKLDLLLDRFQYISIIAVVSAVFSSLLMFVIGAFKTYNAYVLFFSHGNTGPAGKQAIAYSIQGIDTFLIALVFLIFARGVYNIFIRGDRDDAQADSSGHGVDSIAHLKRIIAELIIIILIVNFMEDVLGSDINTYEWEILVIPISIVLLALGLKFLDLRDK